MELTRNGDALRAMLDALFATDAVVGLADGRDGPVVAHEILKGLASSNLALSANF